MNDVDFVMNVFERTYRDVLRPGQIWARANEHRFPFARRVLLVNNVDDKRDLESRLGPMVASNEISDVYFVADRLDEALRKTSLSRKRIQATIHYTDWSLVSVTFPGSSYVMYVDSDVHLEQAVDWISPSLAKMVQDERVAVANPNWSSATLQAEAREYQGDFALGYGFSDQIYLLRRAEFARPIYQHWSPVSWRYPLSHQSPIFEQLVDAYMRAEGRLRATYVKATYLHMSEEGAGYRKVGKLMRWKRRLMLQGVRLAQLLPGDDARYHL